MQTMLYLTTRDHILKKTLLRCLESLREDSSDKSQRCNANQKSIKGNVVNQIIQDENYLMDRRRKRPQQFMRLLYDGPGTGKSLKHNIV